MYKTKRKKVGDLIMMLLGCEKLRLRSRNPVNKRKINSVSKNEPRVMGFLQYVQVLIMRKDGSFKKLNWLHASLLNLFLKLVRYDADFRLNRPL